MFTRADTRGPYTMYMEGIDKSKIHVQLFLNNTVALEHTCRTIAGANDWVTNQVNNTYNAKLSEDCLMM